MKSPPKETFNPLEEIFFPESLLEEHRVRLLLKSYHIRAEICVPPKNQ